MTETNESTNIGNEPIPDATRDDLMRLRHAVPKEPFVIPGIGRVWLWGLKHIEAKQWRAERDETRGSNGASDLYADAKILIRSIRDAAGKPLLTPGDELRVVEWGELVVTQMIGICLRLNGLSADSEEYLRKNFGAILTNAS